jgi:uncharacterized repeat protein (TIGR01451 family)
VVASLMVAKLVDHPQAMVGEVLQYTLVILNDMLGGVDPGSSVHLVDTLPAALELVAGSLSSDASYDAPTRTVHWHGRVAQGGSVEVSFRARVMPAALEQRSVINTMTVQDALDRRLDASANTDVVQPTLTPTPTSTPPGDLMLSGLVYDARLGQGSPISGAHVAVQMCVPRSYEATTGSDGRYTLLLPADYLNACSQVTLRAWATGYQEHSLPVLVSDLRAQPVRDFGLAAVSAVRLYLPVVRSRVSQGGSVKVSFRARLTPAALEQRLGINTMTVQDALERRLNVSAHADVVQPTLTPTSTPPGDSTLSGLVYDAQMGQGSPIPGAHVAVQMCVPRSYEATAGSDGRYHLLLPADYLNACSQVTLSAWATGYREYSLPIAVADLRVQPERDFGLEAMGAVRLYLPVVRR